MGIVFLSDSYTESVDTELSAHLPELGGPIIHHPHANYTSNINVAAATDRIFGTGTSAYYYTVTPPSADYYVEGPFFHASSIAVNIAVCGRMDPTADTMYLGRLTDGTSWTLRKIVNTTATTLGTSTNQIPTVGNSKMGRLVMFRDQIWWEVEGVVEIGPFTDNSITLAGKAGVRTTNASTATTGIHLLGIEAADLALPRHFRLNNLRPAIFKPGRAR